MSVVLLFLMVFLTLYALYKGGQMDQAFQKLLAAVSAIETKADSLIELSNQLAALLRANAQDPAAILELAARLETQTAEVQAAIDANTPPPPPTP